jgi:DNA polymerase (family 10)
MAKDEGVLVAISSDAHSVDGLDVLRYGVGQARRGWLEKKDVLNARPLSELTALLSRARAAADAAAVPG